MRGRDAYLASRCLARSQVGAGGRLKTNQSWGRREGRWRWVQVPGAEQTGRFDGRQASIELQTAGSSCCWRGATPRDGRSCRQCCAPREIDAPPAGIAALGRGGATGIWFHCLIPLPLSPLPPALYSIAIDFVPHSRQKAGSTSAGAISSRPPFLSTRS